MQSISEWPQRGGANGSVRFYPEITHGANAGTQVAAENFSLRAIAGSAGQVLLASPCIVVITCPVCRCTSGDWSPSKHLHAGLETACELLKAIADKYDGVSYADLFQMASAIAIEVSVVSTFKPASTLVSSRALREAMVASLQLRRVLLLLLRRDTGPSLEEQCHAEVTHTHTHTHQPNAVGRVCLLPLQTAGGPKIPLRYGRRDAENPEQCAPEGRLPGE